MLRGSGCNSGGGGGILHNVAQQLTTGGFLDPRQFERANIYESLSDDSTKNPLPEATNLQRFAPAVGDQGHQGSCVAWSSAYGARTIAEAARTGEDPNSLRYSPSFLYNQIGLEGCEGSYIIRAMEYMTKSGAVGYDQFPYTDKDCSRQPDQEMLEEARKHRMRGFNRLTPGDRNNVIDLRAIRENLAQGAPVVIGMMVGGTYMQPMMGKDLWEPTQEDYSMMGFGGHAQCVVYTCGYTGAMGYGYNDKDEKISMEDLDAIAKKNCERGGGTNCRMAYSTHTPGWWASMWGFTDRGAVVITVVRGKSSKDEAIKAARNEFSGSGGTRSDTRTVTSWYVYDNL